jgi:GDP/UDP-N,N'-diacetylbacillosamine 2-epimerase (hydrolysing)
MKKISLVSGSRAEYGQLKPLLMRLQMEKDLEINFVITGAHLNREFGNTQDEINEDLININANIERIPLNYYGDSENDMAISTGEAVTYFAEYLKLNRPDLLVLIGDRYEIFAFSVAAALQVIPIAHICGGSSTLGAVDESLRHSITKMSYLHFTTCDTYRKRVIQLGESPDRVYNVGSLAIENSLNIKLLSREELCDNLSIKKDVPYCVVTFHPVTLELESVESQLFELIQAMDANAQYHYIITLANADAGSKRINDTWEKEWEKRDNWTVVSSLGVKLYLSALKYSEMMIGNSSSGTTEGPAMCIPIINIGNRQKGRVMTNGILSCETITSEIIATMNTAKSGKFKKIVQEVKSPFGDGNTSEKITEIITSVMQTDTINMKKIFYDIQYEV